MSDGFPDLIDSANGFFRDLAENNTREWFEPRKAQYTDTIRKPAALLADLVAEDLGRLTGHSHAAKLFRIHRDVRFSKDKSPYNPHLHMMWSQTGPDPRPVWFFGVAPDYITVGMGSTGLSGARLADYRALVDAKGPALEKAIAAARDEVGATLSDWGPPPLKRVPKPYAPDHPHGDLLRRKGLTLSAPLPEDWRNRGVIPSLGATMAGLRPVWALLDGAY
jgi:uncharacterized protein (TIGR02453 family)